MMIKLEDVIEALEFENEFLNHYYNKKTGIIVYQEESESNSYCYDDINRINEFEEWERELINMLYDLHVNYEDYIKLPKRDYEDEYKMMLEFCNSFSDLKQDYEENYSLNLDYKKEIHALKNKIQAKELINDWYDFREQCEKELAINWCKENNIEYTI